MVTPTINLNIYKQDELEQHNRRENLQIYGVPESNSRKDDVESALFDIADKLGMELDEWGHTKSSPPGKKART